MIESKTNTQIVKKAETAVVEFDKFATVDEALSFCKIVADGKLSPLKKAEDVLNAMLFGKELGLGVMTSVNNIYPIEGKATAGVHVINALLLKAGVIYKILEDYTPLYEYKDKSNIVYNTDTLPASFTLGTVEGVKAGKADVIRYPDPYDYRTTIEFSRRVKQLDGSYEKMTIKTSFSIKDASTAGLLNKTNWKNHPKAMLLARCIAKGGRQIAADVLLGLYETSELAEVHNIEYTVPDISEPVKFTETEEVVENTKVSST